MRHCYCGKRERNDSVSKISQFAMSLRKNHSVRNAAAFSVLISALMILADIFVVTAMLIPTEIT